MDNSTPSASGSFSAESIHSETVLSQPQPELPDGKTIDTCSTQEKQEYLSDLKQYSEYLSRKIAAAIQLHGEPGPSQSKPSTHCGLPNQAEVANSLLPPDATQQLATQSIFPAYNQCPLISLAPASPFDSAPYRYLLEEDKIGKKSVPQKSSVKLWTEIGNGNSLEVEHKDGKVLIREKKRDKGTAAASPSWSSTSETLLCAAADKQSQESSYSEWLKDVLSEPSKSPKHLPATPPKRDPEKEKLRDEAWDVLSAAYSKLSYLESLVYESKDDDFVKELTRDVAEMSGRLTKYIETAEKQGNV